MNRIRKRLTYANVISSLCLFLVLGGGAAFAASHLAKNSVGNKQLRKNAVTGAKVRNHSLTGADIKLTTLGTVPSAVHATVADSASGLSALEPSHVVNAPGQPPFRDGSSGFGGISGATAVPVSFFKDHDGIVHIEGVTEVGTLEEPVKGIVFTLPPGFRPPPGTVVTLFSGNAEIFIFGAGTSFGGNNVEGDVVAGGQKIVALQTSFRAGS